MHVPARPFVRVLVHILLLMGLIPMLLPFGWMMSSAFKSLPEVMQIPPTLVPRLPTLQNFAEVFRHFPFARYLFNSVAVAAIVVGSVVLTSALAGYAFSKFAFPGRDLIFFAMLASLAIPFQVRVIPLYLMAIHFRLVDTLAGVSFPWLFDAFGIFLMRQFMQTVPPDLIETARLDGASEPFIFLRIVLPIMRPALATLAVFTLVGNWEEFMWPLIVTHSEVSRTLPVGLQSFGDQYFSNVHWQMAGALISVTPLVIAFALFQRTFIQGITLKTLRS
jgi:multiple sugar transport system permease protein